jgi:hypothetical protein
VRLLLGGEAHRPFILFSLASQLFLAFEEQCAFSAFWGHEKVEGKSAFLKQRQSGHRPIGHV